MRMLVVLVTLALGAFAQDPVDEAISAIFNSTSNDDFLAGGEFEEIPKDLVDDGFGAIDRCGEGESRGRAMCVPYHNCDAKTKTIITQGSTDGFGLIDIRFGKNSCEHYLDVCCKIPGDGVSPVPTPSPPVTPTRPPAPKPRYCGTRNPQGIDFKITGNKDHEAEYGEFPWMVAILKKDYNPALDTTMSICGGSLISPGVVLTGAHCVYKYKTFDIKVRVGEWDTQTTTERLPYQEVDVSEIIIHENFASNVLYNDVALLVLSQPIAEADHIGTICLPPQNLIFNARNCFASGWGKDTFGKAGQYQVILKKIELPTIARAECQAALRKTRLGHLFELHKSFMCAGGESGKDTCTGDGGSPLVCQDPQNPVRYLQAGIVAWGIGCGDPNVPGVYADVSQFRGWIDEHMARLNLDSKPYTS